MWFQYSWCIFFRSIYLSSIVEQQRLHYKDFLILATFTHSFSTFNIILYIAQFSYELRIKSSLNLISYSRRIRSPFVAPTIPAKNIRDERRFVSVGYENRTEPVPEERIEPITASKEGKSHTPNTCLYIDTDQYNLWNFTTIASWYSSSRIYQTRLTAGLQRYLYQPLKSSFTSISQCCILMYILYMNTHFLIICFLTF